MDNDQTYNSIAFEMAGFETAKSTRKSVARGINTPDVLIIQHQDARDSVTDLATKRTNIRYEYWKTHTSTGKRYRVVRAVTSEVPELAETADLTAANVTFRAMVADADLIEDADAGQL